MKKLLSVVLSLVLIFSVVNLGGIEAFAEGDIIKDGDYQYRLLENGTYAIVGYYGKETNLTFPSEFNGKLITELGDLSCYSLNELVSVTIPDTITTIGAKCFKSCSALETVSIPSSVTNIKYSAFSDCAKLKNVYIDDISAWCETIFDDETSNPLHNGGSLFLCGNLLEYIDIPKDVTRISDFAFFASSIKAVNIPSGVTEIGMCSFAFCNSLTKLTISSSVKTIGMASFSGCSALTECSLPYGVTFIDDMAFDSCSSLKTITIPASVTHIGYGALSNCPSLETLIIKGDSDLNFGNIDNSNLTVYAKSGTPTESYAKANNIPFTSLLIGDTDGDGSVGISDLTLISIYLSGKGELTPVQSACADINEDSTIDAFDMFYIDKAIYA